MGCSCLAAHLGLSVSHWPHGPYNEHAGCILGVCVQLRHAQGASHQAGCTLLHLQATFWPSQEQWWLE